MDISRIDELQDFSEDIEIVSSGDGYKIKAKVDLPRGSFLSIESPVLTLPFSMRSNTNLYIDSWYALPENKRKMIMDRVIKKLYPREKDLIPAICNIYTVDKETANKVKDEEFQRLDLAIQFNAFGRDNTNYLFYLSSYYNHSCDANALFSLKDDNITVVAGKDIKAGEEITLNYCKDIYGMSVKRRREKCYLDCAFLCNCEKCLSEQSCYYCRKHSRSLKNCSRCKTAMYCDFNCQKADWNKHKNVCRNTRGEGKKVIHDL